MRRISSLRFRVPWSRTFCTLPAEYSPRLELLASIRFKLRTVSVLSLVLYLTCGAVEGSLVQKGAEGLSISLKRNCA